MSFYWIIIFVIISVGIVSATILFFGDPYDARGVEARILSDKIVDCLTDGGEFDGQIWASLEEDGNNLQEVCNLNFQDSSYEKNQFYVEIEIDGRKVEYDVGNSGGFKATCDAGTRNYPICYKEKLFVLNGNTHLLIEILTSVRKIEQNVQ